VLALVALDLKELTESGLSEHPCSVTANQHRTIFFENMVVIEYELLR
jgi:hypothetical protein